MSEPLQVGIDPNVRRLDHVSSGADAAGRTTHPKVILRLDTSVDADHETALSAIKRRLGRLLWAQYPKITYIDELGLRLPAQLDRLLSSAGPYPYTFDLTRYEMFVDAIPDELVEPVALAGTGPEVAAQVEALASVGVQELMIHPVPPDGEPSLDVLRGYAAAVLRHE